MKNFYKNKRVLITGNTGFKGTWLSLWLSHMGADVFGYSDCVPTVPALFDCVPDTVIDTEFGDICDFEKLSTFLKHVKPEIIFHLAAQPIVSNSVSNPVNTFMSNSMGMAVLLDAIRGLDFPVNTVLITSDKCYENVDTYYGYKETDSLGGKDPYSASKACAELIFKSYFSTFFKNQTTKRFAVARAGNVIGGGDWSKDRIVVDTFKSWIAGKDVEIRMPNATRPWQHVLEPLSGYLHLGHMLSLHENLNGEAFNFGPAADQNKTVLELLNAMATSVVDLSCGINIQESDVFNEAKLLKLNCEKAEMFLSWRPTLNFSECCQFVTDWYTYYAKNGSEHNLLSFTKKQIVAYENRAREQSLVWAK